MEKRIIALNSILNLLNRKIKENNKAYHSVFNENEFFGLKKIFTDFKKIFN